MNLLKPVAIALAALILVSARPASAQDHPLVPIYPGSKLDDRKAVAFDEFKFPVAKMWANKFTKELALEGKIEHLKYHNPEERSTLEMFRNYQTALKQAGYQTLFSCTKDECGSGYGDTQVGYFNCEQDMRFIAAKLPRPEGDVYVAINISGAYRWTTIAVVEVRPMDNAMSASAPAAAPQAEAPVRAPARAAAVEREDAAPAPAKARGGAKQVTTGIVKGLSQFGMHVKAGSGPGDILVEGDVETVPFQGNDARIKWARSNATISLKDGKSGKTFAQFNVAHKEGSNDYNEAVRRVHVELSKKVAAQINAEISNYFENQ